jgi:hypothetical protein
LLVLALLLLEVLKVVFFLGAFGAWIAFAAIVAEVVGPCHEFPYLLDFLYIFAAYLFLLNLFLLIWIWIWIHRVFQWWARVPLWLRFRLFQFVLHEFFENGAKFDLLIFSSFYIVAGWFLTFFLFNGIKKVPTFSCIITATTTNTLYLLILIISLVFLINN